MFILGISLVAFLSFVGYFFQWSVSKSISFVLIPIFSLLIIWDKVFLSYFGELNTCKYHS